MTLKRILVLNGHPGETSLSKQLAQSYADGAVASGHDVRITHVSDLEFDMDYGEGGYGNPKPLEPCLESFLDDLTWAEHVVMTTPMWWGGMPAKLKGLIDRSFLAGRVFSTRETKFGVPTPMLGGRTGRVIMTSDSPRWYLKLLHRDAMIRQLRGQIFHFVGIKPTKFTYFSGASHPKEGQVDTWVANVAALGRAGA